MLHPSYTELMKVINGDSEEEKVISSRYSIVLASAKRARQIIAGDMPLVEEKDGANHYLQLLKNFGKKKLRFSEMTKKQKNRNSKENRVLRDS